MKTKEYTRNCPSCNELLTYSNYKNWWRANKQNGVCISCSTRSIRGSQARFYRTCSQCKTLIGYKYISAYNRANSRNTMCMSCTQIVPSTGRRQSSETKQKKRLATINYINRKHGQVSPAYNIDACKIFEEINEHFGWKGHHAENGGEFYIKDLGYWVDYYEPNLNLVIEYDEQFHTRYNRRTRDILRQAEIVKNLKCKFIRIPENYSWEQIEMELHNV